MTVVVDLIYILYFLKLLFINGRYVICNEKMISLFCCFGVDAI